MSERPCIVQHPIGVPLADGLLSVHPIGEVQEGRKKSCLPLLPCGFLGRFQRFTHLLGVRRLNEHLRHLGDINGLLHQEKVRLLQDKQSPDERATGSAGCQPSEGIVVCQGGSDGDDHPRSRSHLVYGRKVRHHLHRWFGFLKQGRHLLVLGDQQNFGTHPFLTPEGAKGAAHPTVEPALRALPTPVAPARQPCGARQGGLTVAPFQAWRGSPCAAAQDPAFFAPCASPSPQGEPAGREFSPAIADCGFRARRAPRLARLPLRHYSVVASSCHPFNCQGGLSPLERFLSPLPAVPSPLLPRHGGRSGHGWATVLPSPSNGAGGRRLTAPTWDAAPIVVP